LTSKILLADKTQNDDKKPAVRQLSYIDGSTGSSISVADCAVNNNNLRVDISTGARIDIEGSTATLTFDLSTGATFNKRTNNFTADIANVDLSTGAEVSSSRC